MRKAIVAIGYANYVLDVDKAVQLIELLDEAELYEDEWGKEKTTHYIYEQDPRDLVRSLKIMPASFYRVAKMAGKPEKKR